MQYYGAAELDRFEWDPVKADTNFEKHGISFDEIVDLYRDPDRITFDNTRPSDKEIRFRTVGWSAGRMITAICTVRGNRIRVISIRRTRDDERRRYRANQS